MVYSFFEIERRKNWVIVGLFIFLVTLYFLSFIVCWLVLKNIWSLTLGKEEVTKFYFQLLTIKEILVIFITSFIIGIIHWSISQYEVIERILGILKAEPLNPQDRYHQVLKNIVEEASIACGGTKFKPYIIPTSALNAFSIADFAGRQVIGVTEGLLTKLNRRQIQAAIGHEIAHILSGDCLIATITCSLFELYSVILGSVITATTKTWEDEKGRKGGLFFLIPIYIVFAFTNYMSYIIHSFISRQREYRADAISARLTRDPLGLAEALYIISRGWKGEGWNGDRLSSIFITNPRYSSLDETESFLSDLLSTHPPIKKRIEILLGIAGKDIKFLEDLFKKKKDFIVETKTEIPILPSEYKWYISNSENKWLGPFDLSEIIKFDWLRPHSWIRRIEDDKAKLAYQDSILKGLFQSTTSAVSSKYSCPNCYQGMEEVDYEGRAVWRCVFCRGLLVKRTDFYCILIREEKKFTEEVAERAESIIKDNKVINFKKDMMVTKDTQNLIDCPQCHKKMRRLFFKWGEVINIFDIDQQDRCVGNLISRTTLPFVIDKCIWCDLYWLDHNKLEILQYIYEKYQNV